MREQRMKARSYSLYIIKNAPVYNQRTGQYLFNSLPEEIRAAVRGTTFDPFYKELSQFEIEDWLAEHIIVDDDKIIGVFNNNQILWERKS